MAKEVCGCVRDDPIGRAKADGDGSVVINAVMSAGKVDEAWEAADDMDAVPVPTLEAGAGLPAGYTALFAAYGVFSGGTDATPGNVATDGREVGSTAVNSACRFAIDAVRTEGIAVGSVGKRNECGSDR